MKERGIIFSAPMVKAIAEGRKTQTRRVVRTRLNTWHIDRLLADWSLSGLRQHADAHGCAVFYVQTDVDNRDRETVHCPYGKPGDKLWVRETWREGTPTINGPDLDSHIAYRADVSECLRNRKIWKSPICMPRRASRFSMTITGLRVERLHDIVDGDVEAEGIDAELINRWLDPRMAFASVWDSLIANRGYGWDTNPWVWVLKWEKVEELKKTGE